MQIGINLISPHALPIVTRLLEEGLADFCEIMVDNFIHLPPEKILAAFPGVPLSLHIVASRFLEKSLSDIDEMAARLRPWIAALQPLYVSDHLVQFSKQGRRLPFVTDVNYKKDYETIKNKITHWQALLETTILFENHASMTRAGAEQASFYARLMQDIGVQMLFDFSNAYVAELNKVCDKQVWEGLIKRIRHFHTAGFRSDPVTGLFIDTHDVPIADEVLSWMRLSINKCKTLVVEFDAMATEAKWRAELEKVRAIC